MTRPPFVVGVADLRRRPGTQRPIEISAPLRGVATSAARVAEEVDVRVDGILEAIEGGRFTLSATAEVPWVGECRRCLEPVRGSIDVELSEVFEANPTEGDTYPTSGDQLDLEPAVRDAALLALPLAPLCRDDCAGPAPEAFPTGPAGEPEPEARAPDPRWAALRDLELDD